jgi:hypothetical protein
MFRTVIVIGTHIDKWMTNIYYIQADKETDNIDRQALLQNISVLKSLAPYNIGTKRQ